MSFPRGWENGKMNDSFPCLYSSLGCGQSKCIERVMIIIIIILSPCRSVDKREHSLHSKGTTNSPLLTVPIACHPCLSHPAPPFDSTRIPYSTGVTLPVLGVGILCASYLSTGRRMCQSQELGRQAGRQAYIGSNEALTVPVWALGVVE